MLHANTRAADEFGQLLQRKPGTVHRRDVLLSPLERPSIRALRSYLDSRFAKDAPHGVVPDAERRADRCRRLASLVSADDLGLMPVKFAAAGHRKIHTSPFIPARPWDRHSAGMTIPNDIEEEQPLGCSETHRTWFHAELPGESGRGDVVVVMKNPSWPDTGNVCLSEARRMAIECGFSNLYVGNLYGTRTARPSQLNDYSYRDAVHRENDAFLSLMAAETDLVVAAWGGPNGIDPEQYHRRVSEVVDLLGADRITSFGVTANGQPRHCFSWRFHRPPLAAWDIGRVRW